jgi:dTDP-glucose 4,6-dehydratase
VIILNSLNQREIGIYGNGQQIRDWIYVDDHTEGLLMVLEKGISGSTYNIGSNHEMSNIELTKKICNILDNKLKPKKSFSELITYVDDRPGHDTHYAIDSSKIIGDLGWKPNISLHEGLVKTIDWYLNNQDWLFELEKREGVGNRLGLSRAKNK